MSGADPGDDAAEQTTAPPSLSYAWRDLTSTDMEALGNTTQPEARVQLLAVKTGLLNSSTDARSAILVDLYFGILAFAEEEGFDGEQSSALFSIVKAVHHKAMMEKQVQSKEVAFAALKELLLQHSQSSKVPGAVGLFDVEDVRDIVSFLTRTYFSHYSLYEAVFSQEQEEDIQSSTIFMETAMVPRPLATAKLESEYLASLEKKKLDEEAVEAAEARAEEIEEKLSEALDEGLPWLAEITDGMSKEEVQSVIATTITNYLDTLRTTLASDIEAHTQTTLSRMNKLESEVVAAHEAADKSSGGTSGNSGTQQGKASRNSTPTKQK